jgi:hypothetical protein
MFNKKLCLKCRKERKVKGIGHNDYPFCGPDHVFEQGFGNCKTLPSIFSSMYTEPPDWCPFLLEHVLTKGKSSA